MNLKFWKWGALTFGILITVQNAGAQGSVSNEIKSEWSALVAKHYPTLGSAKIDLIWSESPDIFTESDIRKWTVVIGPKGYTIKVSRPLWVKGPPRDVLKAIWAHELSHVLEFQTMSFFGIFHFYDQYTGDEPFRIETERTADLAAMRLGYGKELIAYREWLYGAVPESKLAGIKKLYRTPEEIKDWMTRHP